LPFDLGPAHTQHLHRRRHPQPDDGRALDRAADGGARPRLPLTPDAEITLEANPGTVEAEKFAAFRDAGVNRLSIGVQSFDDRHLQRSAASTMRDARTRAIDLAQRTFRRVNLDLMYALPQQSRWTKRRTRHRGAGHGRQPPVVPIT
jgi:hypothetical protein